MASTDARPVPIKNTAFRVSFDLRLNTGALNSGAAGLDSEVSKDGGTAADCTNEATEIATSTGHYFLDLTSTEMNADCVVVQVKSSTTNAVTRSIVLYPQEAGDIKVDVETLLASAAAAQNMKLAALAMAQGTIDNSGGFTLSATAIQTNTIAGPAADHWKDRLMVLTSGTLIQQIARITANTAVSGGLVQFTTTAFTSAPANGVTVLIV